MGDSGAVLRSPDAPQTLHSTKDAYDPTAYANGAPFQSQLGHFPHPPNAYHNHGPAFHMGSSGQSWPPVYLKGHGPMHNMQQPYVYQQTPQSWPGHPVDPMNAAGAQQMHQPTYPVPLSYGAFQPAQQFDPRMQLSAYYNGNTGSANHRGAIAHAHHYPAPWGPGQLQASTGDVQHHAQRSQESRPAPVPSVPRGPPRKPKQSGHALWTGNLPSTASVGDLKDHFSRDATQDIESLFLISKSNCAFVNYKSRAATEAAIDRFNNSTFNGARLACRMRRENGSISEPAASTNLADNDSSEADTNVAEAKSSSPQTSAAPMIARNDSVLAISKEDSAGSSTVTQPAKQVLEKFFIVKSLTIQDLESSVRNGIWATQTHNDEKFNQAFEKAQNVYLIFSANKSGEYFGYARMTSKISGELVSLNASADSTQPDSPNMPHSIPAPATATAPKGRIVDDSARGTIYWEADSSESEKGVDEDSSSNKSESGSESASDSDWGRQFSIQWISTTHLPFYRTRGLRNPLNCNREIKIARDGTEVDPNVAAKLLQMFHRPAQTHRQW